jgi:hypothetical protein
MRCFLVEHRSHTQEKALVSAQFAFVKPFSALVPFCSEVPTPVYTFPCSKNQYELVELYVRALGVQPKMHLTMGECGSNQGWTSVRTYAGETKCLFNQSDRGARPPV